MNNSQRKTKKSTKAHRCNADAQKAASGGEQKNFVPRNWKGNDNPPKKKAAKIFFKLLEKTLAR